MKNNNHRDWINEVAKGIFIAVGVVIIGFVVQNPEAVGDWFRQLIGQ